MESVNKNLLVVVGPTAVGKTALGIKLAQHYDTEIISADSRQVYREMEKGTAKPDPSELERVKHYLVNSHSIYDTVNAATFEQEALSILVDIFKDRDVAIVVGGSGLYVDALCKGLDDIPEIDLSVRHQLNEILVTEGLELLQEQLKMIDPDYYNLVDLKNPQRIIRALEVSKSTGKPYSSFRKRQEAERPFNIIKIGLDMDRDELYLRIDQRMDYMIKDGLFEEAEQLFSLRHLNALQTVGYSEIFGFLEGKYDREEAVRLLKRNSRRYAKRQLTWFRRDESIQWFASSQYDQIIDFIDNSIK